MKKYASLLRTIGVFTLVGAGLLLLLLARGRFISSADAAEPAEIARKADREAIRGLSAQFQRAFEKGDASAAAALLTAGVELAPDDAPPVQGRDTVQKTLAAHFAKNPRVKITLEVESLRFTSRDTAIEEGHMTTTPEKGEPESNHYSILYVREDGKWLMAQIKEWPSEQTHLRDLDWLIGAWVAKRGDAEIHSTYEWFGNKSYIRAHFSIRRKGKTFAGTQMIGTDRDSGQLFTRTFEVDGGYGEGACRREGKKWIFETETTLGDGAVLSATNILVQIDNNTFTWQPVNVTVDGEPVSGQAPVKVTRVKE